jgi:hypothetical protein
MFLFKKIKISTFLGSSQLRRALIICSAFEKILSDGTEVAGIMEYFNAMLLSGANTNLCSFQYVAMLQFNP